MPLQSTSEAQLLGGEYATFGKRGGPENLGGDREALYSGDDPNNLLAIPSLPQA